MTAEAADAIAAAMDRRSVLGVVSDLLDVIMSATHHLSHVDEHDPFAEGVVSGLLMGFAVAVDGVELIDGNMLDARALRDRGALLVNTAAHDMHHHEDN